MSLTHHEVSDWEVAANQSNAQKSTGWIRKVSEQSRNLFSKQLHPTLPCDRHHPSPRGKRKGPTTEVASSAIAKTPEASDGAQPDGRNEPPKPECNLESATCRIAPAAGRPIAKVDEAGTQPNGRNARPKPECNLESTTSRIPRVVGHPIAKVDEAGTQPNGRNAPPNPECNLESTISRISHVVGRPIAKAGETGTGAQPDSGNEPPKPGSADLGCKGAALRVKQRNPPAAHGIHQARDQTIEPERELHY